MPTPSPDESRDDFIDRCMGDAEAVSDYPDTDQRLAVCNSLWEGEKSMNIQTKAVPFELKKEPDEDGTIEGYASVFDVVDNGMDVISPGAFRKTLNSPRKVRMLWQHNMSEPIGVWDQIEEDGKGLYVKGRLAKDVTKGREAMALYKMGAMDSLSIGYRTIDATPEGNGRVRRLNEVELWEISAVTIPMLDEARASVKSIKTIREFERALRDAGFSQNEAKAVAADGFRGLADHRDDVEVEAETVDLRGLYDQIRQLQEKFTNV
jgi:HK97 family phage prohead protease